MSRKRRERASDKPARRSRAQQGQQRARYQGPVPVPRRPGPRQHRQRRAEARLRTIIRQDHPAWPEARVREEAERQLHQLLLPGHPKTVDEYIKLAPASTAPNRLKIFELVEAAAVRRLPEFRDLEDYLAPCRLGRPSQRRLSLAVFEKIFLVPGRPSIKHTYQEFIGANALLDWAFDHPAAGANYRSRSAVNSTLAAMLDRHDPELCLKLTVRGFRHLAELKGERDLGRFAVIDGTDMPAPREQVPDYSYEEEAELNDGLTIDLGYDHVRGTTLLLLWCMKSCCPMSYVEFPRSGNEHQWATAAIDNLLTYWPEAPIEILVGDKAFDDEMLYRDLVFRYGIEPVSDLRGSVTKQVPHADSGGVPLCSQHGLMQLERSPDFYLAADRLRDGVRTGLLNAKETAARLVWRCPAPGCEVRETTYPRRSARLYTYYPRQGAHRRVATREALMLRRSMAECGIGNLKHRGLAGRGVEVARWLNTDNRRRWFQGACILAMTLRRLAHETGEYERALAEAEGLGLIKRPPAGR